MAKQKIGSAFKNFLIFFSALFSALLFSCASTPDVSTGFSTGTYEHDLNEKTAINKEGSEERKNKNYTYFSAVPESIMHDVEVGSPSSLRKAVQAIRKQNSELTENEKVLIAVVSDIMQIAWPNERVDWETAEVSGDNSYLGAINSAKNGIYDRSTGNVDFLTVVLPSLVVLKTSDVSSFFIDSEAALKNGLSMCPDSVLSMYLLGLLYNKNGQYEKAAEQLKRANSLEPELLQVSYAYSESLFLSGNEKAAEEQVMTILSKYPSDINALKLASKIFFKEKNYSKAEEYVSRVLQQEPNDLPSVLFRARILMEKKDYIHAASLLDVYSRQDSRSKEYLLLRAQIQYEWSKNNTAAVLTIESALKNYPSDKDVMLYAAKISGETGLAVAEKSAEDYANEILLAEPDNETALFYSAEGFVRKKDWKNAYNSSKKLLQKNGSKTEYIVEFIEICLQLKRYDEAWNLISQLYKDNSADEEITKSYIKVMVASGRTQQAISLINQLLDSSAAKMKSFLYYERSLMRTTQENMLTDLRSSLISNPRNSDALYRLYEIYYERRDYRKAQYYLKQVVALNPADSELRALNEKLSSIVNGL